MKTLLVCLLSRILIQKTSSHTAFVIFTMKNGRPDDGPKCQCKKAYLFRFPFHGRSIKNNK